MSHWVPTGPLATTVIVEENQNDNIFPTSTFLHHHLSSMANLIIVANHVEELCTIPLELYGKLTVDAILDESSHIIEIQWDI